VRWVIAILLFAALCCFAWASLAAPSRPVGLYTKADASADGSVPLDGAPRATPAAPRPADSAACPRNQLKSHEQPAAGQNLCSAPAQSKVADQGVLPSYWTEVEGKPHQVFITIDDHPGTYTPDYLDLLQRYRLKAVFFIVSYALYGYLRTPQYGPTAKLVEHLRRALREGHVLGNHSVSHGLMCSMVKWRVQWEVGKSQEWVKQVLGIEMKLWRPPHGHLCRLVQQEVAKRQLRTIMWDVDDWRSTPESMVRIVKLRASRGSTSTMVLFHRDVQKFRKFLLLLPPQNPAKN
jgi:peptidoglycan/xylan/chitin deacetylase (PgdA/CDA1 family)